MELGNAIEFICNKTILITGATGFLAKVIMEKILRVQPNVKKLYLLIRVQDNKSAHERLHNEEFSQYVWWTSKELEIFEFNLIDQEDLIIRKELFRVLRQRHGAEFESFISEKVAPINGDTSLFNLGLTEDSDIHKNIDVIIHAAAATRFEERYDLALGINTFGSSNVIHFAQRCPKLQILIDVSTAYVCGEKKAGLIQETAIKMGDTLGGKYGFDIDAEKKLVDKTLNDLTSKGASTKEIRDTMKSLGLKRAKLNGWPNTYVFTKAMAETLIWEHRGNLPTVIVRPTMISSTYKEPFPGWIEGAGSVATVSIVCGKQLITFTHADGNSIFDLIPVDMVANSIMMAMVANANMPCLNIYQVGSSLRNPLPFSKLLDINYKYFAASPWIDGQGTVVKVHKIKLVKSQVHFFLLLVSLIVKFTMVNLVDKVSSHYFRVNQDKLKMQIKVTYKNATIFKPFIFFGAIFDDKNTEKLRIEMRKHGLDEGFDFDPKCIDWEDYLMNTHIPATVRYLF